jgi:glycosyltransferase involved in cell wall biosynthesis
MHTVLHITPHLGGGVGRVLLNYLEKVKRSPDFRHKVLSLEFANDRALLGSRTTGFPLTDRMSSDHGGMLASIAAADIVLLHWWNHPLLFDFLVREKLPPARIIFWSHISGFQAPYVFSDSALNYPDLFVFTTPLSMEVPVVKNLGNERHDALRAIWSTGGIEHVTHVRPKLHSGFNVGYIGTVDYCKMHAHFLSMCSRVRIPNVQFIVCGGPSDRQIQEESLRHETKNRFLFAGQVEDINKYLSEFDVFGYPLAPYHYGTCEQSLCEAMAAGVPPVVLANKVESYMVQDGINGMVARDEDAYVQAIEELYVRPELRQILSANALEAARSKYSLDQMIVSWDKVFEEVMHSSKKERQWSGKHSGQTVSPACVFLESLGAQADPFRGYMNAQDEHELEAAEENIRRLYSSSYLWRSDTRGTPRHYHYFFPDDTYLKIWSSIADKVEVK